VSVFEKTLLVEEGNNRFPKNLSSRGLIISNHLVNSSVLVKREVLRSIGNFVESPKVLGVEDYATWLRISVDGKLFGLDEPLVHYTVSDSSLSRRANGRTRLDALEDFLGWLESNSTQQARGIGLRFFAFLVVWKERLTARVRSAMRLKKDE
jgi:hypothetical protein